MRLNFYSVLTSPNLCERKMYSPILVLCYYRLLRSLRIFFCNLTCVSSTLTICNLHTTENYFVSPRGMKERKSCGLYQPLACYYRTSSFSCYVVFTEEVVLKWYSYAVLSDMPHLPSANNLNTVAGDGQHSVSIRPSVSRKRHRPPRTG